MSEEASVQIEEKQDRTKKLDRSSTVKSKQAKIDQDMAGASGDGAEALANGTSDESQGSLVNVEKERKRKRGQNLDELEIDVSLPEPPSKKALRKAKKAKPGKTSLYEKSAAKEENNFKAEDVENEIEGEAEAGAPEAKERRTEHSIWIGNLPWTCTKQDLRDFLQDQAGIPLTRITRLHMPAPSAAANKNTHGRPAFKNRGFAYVDFDSADMLFAALQLTEVPFNGSGRNVLVKNAKSFEGRPEAHTSISAEGRNARGKMVDEKPPSKRIFVGNLGFDVTKETIEEHFAQCGAIEHVHMATFEDSGKCKGFAWITFSSIQAAEAAIRGYVLKEQEDDDPHDVDGVQVDNEGNGQATKSRKKLKPRKWFVNRLLGREIKREYAEDASVRYKKRFGGKKDGESNTSVGFEAPIAAEEDKPQSNNSAHDRRRQQRRAQKYGDEFRKVDARTIAPGAALSHAPRASAAIRTDGQKGRKAIFD